MVSPVCPLRLDEYALASQKFFSDAVEAVACASNPILAQMQREKVEVLPTSLNTVESGEVIRRDPFLSSANVSFSVADGIKGDFSDVQAGIADTADQFISSIMPKLFAHISEICEATGNIVSGEEHSVWDAILEMLEVISITFDEDGNPSLPSIVMHPSTAAKISNPPEGHEEKCNEIIARRRDEWLARRRTRRLPRHGR